MASKQPQMASKQPQMASTDLEDVIILLGAAAPAAVGVLVVLVLVLHPLDAGLDHAQREERRRRRKLGHGGHRGLLVALRWIKISSYWTCSKLTT